MNDTASIHELIRFTFDSSKPSITIESDWLLLIIVIAIILIAYFIRKPFIKRYFWKELEIEISGSPKITYKVARNDENLFIANRIYIELTTRKAAIPIDESNDVIEEVYNSWYKLFGIIRDEIKSLPGRYLREHDPTSALIGLTSKILNDALRPHSTLYQARFRKWLEDARKDSKYAQLTPQELQKKYPDYDNLIKSMKEVNITLIDYANELYKLIKGK
jgi:hypothetical protein